jgi:hypothetical protein
MDSPLYTQAAALAEANAVRLTLADPDATPALVSVVRLFTSALVPSVVTTKIELEAAEAAFTGYPAGGYQITSFFPAILATGGGAVIYSPTIAGAYTTGAAAAIGGYWLEDDAGNVREVYIYSPARNLANPGDGWPIVVSLGYGRNA